MEMKNYYEKVMDSNYRFITRIEQVKTSTERYTTYRKALYHETDLIWKQFCNLSGEITLTDWNAEVSTTMDTERYNEWLENISINDLVGWTIYNTSKVMYNGEWCEKRTIITTEDPRNAIEFRFDRKIVCQNTFSKLYNKINNLKLIEIEICDNKDKMICRNTYSTIKTAIKDLYDMNGNFKYKNNKVYMNDIDITSYFTKNDTTEFVFNENKRYKYFNLKEQL